MILLSDTQILDMGALDNGSARRRDLYLTTHNTHNRQTSMPPAGFEPAFPSSEWPLSHALDCATSGNGLMFLSYRVCSLFSRNHSVLFDLLKPTGHVMHHQFNIQQLYALPTLYLCVLYLSENKQRLVPLTA